MSLCAIVLDDVRIARINYLYPIKSLLYQRGWCWKMNVIIVMLLKYSLLCVPMVLDPILNFARIFWVVGVHKCDIDGKNLCEMRRLKRCDLIPPLPWSCWPLWLFWKPWNFDGAVDEKSDEVHWSTSPNATPRKSVHRISAAELEFLGLEWFLNPPWQAVNASDQIAPVILGDCPPAAKHPLPLQGSMDAWVRFLCPRSFSLRLSHTGICFGFVGCTSVCIHVDLIRTTPHTHMHPTLICASRVIHLRRILKTTQWCASVFSTIHPIKFSKSMQFKSSEWIHFWVLLIFEDRHNNTPPNNVCPLLCPWLPMSKHFIKHYSPWAFFF